MKLPFFSFCKEFKMVSLAHGSRLVVIFVIGRLVTRLAPPKLIQLHPLQLSRYTIVQLPSIENKIMFHT